MDFFTNVQEAANDYWKDIPADTGKKMLFGFAASSVIRTLISGNISSGIFSGTVAALATGIHAFVTPLFLNIFDHKDRLTWEEEMARTSIAVVGAGYLASAFGDMSILANLLSMSILYGLYNSIDLNRRDLDKSSWFVIFPG